MMDMRNNGNACKIEDEVKIIKNQILHEFQKKQSVFFDDLEKKEVRIEEITKKYGI